MKPFAFRCLVTTLLAASAASAQATEIKEFYRCEVGKVVVFSDRPCESKSGESTPLYYERVKRTLQGDESNTEGQAVESGFTDAESLSIRPQSMRDSNTPSSSNSGGEKPRFSASPSSENSATRTTASQTTPKPRPAPTAKPAPVVKPTAAPVAAVKPSPQAVKPVAVATLVPAPVAVKATSIPAPVAVKATTAPTAQTDVATPVSQLSASSESKAPTSQPLAPAAVVSDTTEAKRYAESDEDSSIKLPPPSPTAAPAIASNVAMPAKAPVESTPNNDGPQVVQLGNSNSAPKAPVRPAPVAQPVVDDGFTDEADASYRNSASARRIAQADQSDLPAPVLTANNDRLQIQADSHLDDNQQLTIPWFPGVSEWESALSSNEKRAGVLSHWQDSEDWKHQVVVHRLLATNYSEDADGLMDALKAWLGTQCESGAVIPPDWHKQDGAINVFGEYLCAKSRFDNTGRIGIYRLIATPESLYLIRREWKTNPYKLVDGQGVAYTDQLLGRDTIGFLDEQARAMIHLRYDVRYCESQANCLSNDYLVNEREKRQ